MLSIILTNKLCLTYSIFKVCINNLLQVADNYLKHCFIMCILLNTMTVLLEYINGFIITSISLRSHYAGIMLNPSVNHYDQMYDSIRPSLVY